MRDQSLDNSDLAQQQPTRPPLEDILFGGTSDNNIASGQVGAPVPQVNMGASQVTPTQGTNRPPLEDILFGQQPTAPANPMANLNQLAQGMASNETPEQKIVLRQQAETARQQAMKNYNESLPAYQRFASGIETGFKSGALGLGQAEQSLENMLGHPNADATQDLNEEAANLEAQGKGTGVAGAVGELVGNPVNYAMMAMPGGPEWAGAKGVVARGAVRGAEGAGYGAIAPTSNEDQRGTNVGIGAALNTLVPPVAQGITNVIGKTIQNAGNVTGLSDLAANWAQKLGFNPSTSKVYDAAQSLGLNTEGKSPAQIEQNVKAALTKGTGDVVNEIGGPNNYMAKNYDPLLGNVAISAAYDKELQQSKGLYTQVKQLGQDKQTEVGDLLQSVDSLISDIDKRKFVEPDVERAKFELQNWRDTIQPPQKPTPPSSILDQYGQPIERPQEAPTKPTLGYNDVVDLKQVLNQNFDPSKFATRGDAPYAKLANSVNGILKDIGEKDKSFGNALKTANDHWGGVSETWRDNPVLSKFWKPDDYYESGKLGNQGFDSFSDDMTKRSNNWMNNIKDSTDIRAIARALPPMAADDFRGAVAKNIIEKTGLDANALANDNVFPLIKQAAQDDPDKLDSLNKLRTVVKYLNSHGLKGDFIKTPEGMETSIGQKLEQEENLNTKAPIDNILSALYDRFINKPKYALMQLFRAGTQKKTPTGEQLLRFQKNLNQGAPGRQTITNLAGQASPYIGKAAGLATLNRLNP